MSRVMNYSGLPLPDHIEHLTSATPKARRAEVEDVLSRGFCGQKGSVPEFSLDFILGNDPSVRPNPHPEPLSEEPTEKRLKNYKFLCGISLRHAIKRGGCYAVKGAQGEVVAAAVAYPPGAPHLGFDCGLMCGMCCELGVWPSGPSYIWSDRNARYEKAFAKMQKEVYKPVSAANPCWYIMVMSCDPKKQGHGHGRKLMEWLTTVADADNASIYVETATDGGARKFYSRHGFSEDNGGRVDTIDMGKGDELKLSAMVRLPRGSAGAPVSEDLAR